MVKRRYLMALSRTKIRVIHLQDLRHTHGALRIEQGQIIFYISNQTGRATVITTLDVYGHLRKEVHAEHVQKLDAILGFANQPGSSSESIKRRPQKRRKRGFGKPLPLNPFGDGDRF
jgi:hypothetical protein